ncbi:hypothetical protein [Nocardia sp. IFM 10818]
MPNNKREPRITVTQVQAFGDRIAGTQLQCAPIDACSHHRREDRTHFPGYLGGSGDELAEHGVVRS